MAELVFWSGTMDCGKSTLALQIDHNHRARGRRGLIFTRLDRAGDHVLSSRLGLSTARRLAERMGGRLDAARDAWGATTYSLGFPAARAGQAPDLPARDRPTATALYAVCLISMLAASTAYNLSHICPARPILRRMDEAAIFLMIAGSYTPFATQRFEGAWAVGFTHVAGLLRAGGLLDVTGMTPLLHVSQRFPALQA